jgi:peptidoglycan hydrolase CwlO-like protein
MRLKHVQPIGYTSFLGCVSFFCFVLWVNIFHTSVAHADTASDRALLQTQLLEVQAQIQENQTKLGTTQQQQASLERDVTVLNGQIKESQLEMQQRDLQIAQLKDSIGGDQQSIQSLDSSVKDGMTSLAQIMRNVSELDQKSPAQITLSGSFSDVFRENDDYQAIQKSMQAAFVKMSQQRDDLSAHVSSLQDKKQQQSDMLVLQTQQKKTLQSAQQNKQTLISATKGQESTYKKLIATQQQTAAQIQKALFTLANGNTSVSFGDIYSYAKEAGAATGVRPAVILGILSEESNLGQNVGTGNWKTDMHPTRDAPIFQTICAQLGLNPDTQPVSKKAWYGWGGAMGPGQFIPSTWVQYADRISAATNQSPPNPWSPRTAAFATALLMKDNGADGGDIASERLAALRYLAGWKNATNPKYAFYGNEVMALAAKYQKDIDVVNAGT